MMKFNLSRRVWSLLIILLLLLNVLNGYRFTTYARSGEMMLPLAARENSHSFIKIIQANPESIILEINPPAPQFTSQQLTDQNCQVVQIPGLARSDTPGLPALPMQGAMLGIPTDAQPIVKILAVEAHHLPGQYNLCPAAQPNFARDSDRRWQLTGYTYPRGAGYQVDGFSPEAVAELVTTGNIRSQRYAQIRFNPLQYNPVSGVLRYTTRIQVEITFNALRGSRLAESGVFHILEDGWQRFTQASIDEGYFEDTLRSLLLNYDQARQWRSHPASTAQVASINAPQNGTQYKVEVKQDGIYQITYANLINAGIPAATLDSLDPRTFHLTNQASEIAIRVEGEPDGIFNPGDAILFYGQKNQTKYTDTNVYWLSWGGANGLRMEDLDSAPSGAGTIPVDFYTSQHVETDAEYYSEEPSSSNNDHWYWAMISAYEAPAFMDFQFDLNHRSSESHTARVRGSINGYYASPNHHTKIYLNSTLIDDHSFASGAEYNFSIDIQQADLLEGTNTLRIECPLDGGILEDDILVNWFAIDYYDTYFAENDQLLFDGDLTGTYEYQVDGFSSEALEAYDITDPAIPKRISGATVTGTAIRQRLDFETTIADEHHYLAQTTSQRLSPLSISQDSPSNWKSSTNGADYIIITHADFLNQAQALANYRASQNLRVAVVDVQDLYDEFNYGIFSPEAIKSFLAYAYANWITPAPSFVLLVGDGHFDFKNNLGYNEKIYIPPYLDDVDPWIGETVTDNRLVSVSGNDSLPDMYIGRFPVRSSVEAQTMVEKAMNYEQVPPVGGWNANVTFIADNADGGGDFAAISDSIATYVTDNYSVDKVYYAINYTSISDARAAIQAAINAGRLLVSYTGHGSRNVWASEGLFKLTDISSLTNGSKLPFILPMTCSEGYFIYPSPVGQDYSAMAETFVRYNGKGAIASFSPTGYGSIIGHDYLERSIYSDIFNYNHTQLGFLTTNAKYYLYANSPGYQYMVETYLLFGDPAVNLQTLPYAVQGPTDLQATAISSTQINLTWQDNSSDESQFFIERSLDGSTNWQEIGSVEANIVTFSDIELDCSTTYHYRVRAYRALNSDYSKYTDVTNATTYPCYQYNLQAGWNLIALPYIPFNPVDAESILQAINAQGGNCTEIDAWSAGLWVSHPLGMPFNQFSINMGEGYFIKCSKNSSWAMEGKQLVEAVPINLKPGWNLIGMPYTKLNYTAQNVLDDVKIQEGNCSEIVRWQDGLWVTHPDGFQYNNFTIDHSQGYFLNCSMTSTFIPIILR